jgi:hypothetical protein
MLCVYDFQVADSKLVKPYVFILINTRNRGDVRGVFMLGVFQVMENGACSDNGFTKSVNAKPFKRGGLELIG